MGNKKINCIRLFSDDKGESHFENTIIKLNTVNFSPPAPPLYLSSFNNAKQYAILNAPVGWKSDWHPVPFKQIHFYLSGQVEAEVSDGEIRQLKPGDIVLVEDTTGKGHRSRTIGTTEVTIAIVQLD